MPCLNEQRLSGMLGFAMRAGKLTLGTEQVVTAVRGDKKKRPLLVLIASDVSDNTLTLLKRKSSYYEIPSLCLPFSMERIGQMLGKLHGVAAVAVGDTAFAKEISACFGEELSTKGSSDQGTR